MKVTFIKQTKTQGHFYSNKSYLIYNHVTSCRVTKRSVSTGVDTIFFNAFISDIADLFIKLK